MGLAILDIYSAVENCTTPNKVVRLRGASTRTVQIFVWYTVMHRNGFTSLVLQTGQRYCRGWAPREGRVRMVAAPSEPAPRRRPGAGAVNVWPPPRRPAARPTCAPPQLEGEPPTSTAAAAGAATCVVDAVAGALPVPLPPLTPSHPYAQAAALLPRQAARRSTRAN